MKKLNVVAFEPWHMDHIQMRQHEVTHLDKVTISAVATMSRAVTMFMDELIVTIIGMMEIAPGVAEVFLVPSIYLPKFRFSVLRELKLFLAMVDVEFGLHRIQTCSLANEQTDRWMEYLGFECEGTLRQFTFDKLDYRMWSRLRG